MLGLFPQVTLTGVAAVITLVLIAKIELDSMPSKTVAEKEYHELRSFEGREFGGGEGITL